jgi:hypothetical protein
LIYIYILKIFDKFERGGSEKFELILFFCNKYIVYIKILLVINLTKIVDWKVCNGASVSESIIAINKCIIFSDIL